jgi:hypothetical protein
MIKIQTASRKLIFFEAERSPALLPKPNVLQRTDQPQLLPVRRFTRRAAVTNARVVGVVAALLAGKVTATSGQTIAVSIQASLTTG